jgi:hypothetical protein
MGHPWRTLGRWAGVRPAAVGALSLAAAACTGVIGDALDGPAPPGPETRTRSFVPAAPTMHRLTAVQLHNAYLALFGEPLALPELPGDDQLYGFTSIAAATRTVSPLDAEKYEAAAYGVLDQVWSDAARRLALVGCSPSGAADPCVRDFYEGFGLRAWRRPLEPAELDTLLALGASVESFMADSWEGVRYGAAAILQSPYFLFRVERGEPDAATGLLRYTPWELAARLSFLLTDSPPHDGLLFAAETGELSDPALIAAHAAVLLETPAARAALGRFFRDFMGIGRLDQLDKSLETFPQFTATLGPAMRQQIERMFEDTVFTEQGDFRQLFTTRATFVNEELGKIYGLDGVVGPDFVPVTLPDDGRRGGLLTTPGFLAMNAYKTQTSPTHRGRFVRISLLCQDVPPPPPGVDTTIPALDPANPKTLRERLEAHRANPSCAGCHDRMDPIGFGLEGYDALGAYRESDESGLPIDAATELDGVAFTGGVELGKLVAELDEVGRCVARRFYQHATAHLDERGEHPAVEDLVSRFVASDYDFKELVVAMVVNDGFLYASAQAELAEEVQTP